LVSFVGDLGDAERFRGGFMCRGGLRRKKRGGGGKNEKTHLGGLEKVSSPYEVQLGIKTRQEHRREHSRGKAFCLESTLLR